MATEQTKSWVRQTSEGVGGEVHTQATYFLPEGTHLSCQVSPLDDKEIVVSFDMSYCASISLHGTPADLRRLSELIRTTLDEWEGK